MDPRRRRPINWGCVLPVSIIISVVLALIVLLIVSNTAPAPSSTPPPPAPAPCAQPVAAPVADAASLQLLQQLQEAQKTQSSTLQRESSTTQRDIKAQAASLKDLSAKMDKVLAASLPSVSDSNLYSQRDVSRGMASGTDSYAVPPIVRETDGTASVKSAAMVSSSPDEHRTYMVILGTPGLVKVVGKDARTKGSLLNKQQRMAHLESIRNEQNPVIDAIKNSGGSVLKQLRLSSNGVLATLTAGAADTIKNMPGVVDVVHADANFTIDAVAASIATGAAYARSTYNVTGRGVVVLVIDTGIDYTHSLFGGPGFPENYTSNNPAIVEPGTFPTAKVIGGYDFVRNDPDPLDQHDHGTHVASIVNTFAPDVKFRVARVCTPSCLQYAMYASFEYALDPEDSGDINTDISIVQMSIGNVAAPDNSLMASVLGSLNDYGILCAVAAGNNGNIPFVTGSYAQNIMTTTTGSVMNASIDYASLNISAPANIAIPADYDTALVSWAPLIYGWHGRVAYIGEACDLTSIPSASTTGATVALIIRGGTCLAATVKAYNAQSMGYSHVIIAMDAPGAPISFSYSPVPSPITVPTIICTFARFVDMHTAMMNGDAVYAGTNPMISVAHGHLIDASTSSRGPTENSRIKADILAPGSNIIGAARGTGNGYMMYSGTSMATPCVSGSAALLIEQFPGITPRDVKARLMNTANSSVWTYSPSTGSPLDPTNYFPLPATRKGAGMLRTAAAIATPITAIESTLELPSLSFGYMPMNNIRAKQTLHLIVTGTSSASSTYNVTYTFDVPTMNTGAVRLALPPAIVVAGNGGQAKVPVHLSIDGSKLPAWPYLDNPVNVAFASVHVGNPTLFDVVEMSGSIVISNSVTSIHVPWMVIPRKVSALKLSAGEITLNGRVAIGISNERTSLVSGTVHTYALLGTSEQFSAKYDPRKISTDPLPIVDLKWLGATGLYDANGNYYGIEVAVSTFNVRSSIYAFRFVFAVIVNDRYELGVSGTPSNPYCYLYDYVNGGTIYAHCGVTLYSDTVVFRTMFTQIPSGLGSDDTITLLALSLDSYSSLPIRNEAVADYITGSFVPSKPRFVANPPILSVAPGQTGTITVAPVEGGAAATPGQLGFLLWKTSEGTSDILRVKPGAGY